MNTKEAIEFMEKGKESMRTDEKDFPNTDEVIRLLKRGGKYEEIWRGLKLGLDIPKINLLINGEDICKAMKRFEQKYFPKGGRI